VVRRLRQSVPLGQVVLRKGDRQRAHRRQAFRVRMPGGWRQGPPAAPAKRGAGRQAPAARQAVGRWGSPRPQGQVRVPQNRDRLGLRPPGAPKPRPRLGRGPLAGGPGPGQPTPGAPMLCAPNCSRPCATWLRRWA
jgi:hypothetical protein